MAERSPLSPEEHDYLTQMVKSPGWRVLMEKLIIPELVQVSRHIDNVNEGERDTQLYRGAKLTLTRLLATMYKWARLPNPLDEHYQGLITAVRGYTEDYIPPANDIAPLAAKPQDSSRLAVPLPPRKVSRPV